MTNGIVVRTSERYSGESTKGTKNAGHLLAMNCKSTNPARFMRRMTVATTINAMVAVAIDRQCKAARRA